MDCSAETMYYGIKELMQLRNADAVTLNSLHENIHVMSTQYLHVGKEFKPSAKGLVAKQSTGGKRNKTQEGSFLSYLVENRILKMRKFVIRESNMYL